MSIRRTAAGPRIGVPARAVSASPSAVVIAAVIAATVGWTAPAAAQTGFEPPADPYAFEPPVAADPAPPPAAAAPRFGGFTTDVSAARTLAARITAGAGLGFAPDYFGSDDTSLGFAGTLRFDYLRLPGGIEFGSVGAPGLVRGFGPRGSVRYISSRRASDNAELRGLDDVDSTLEIGLGIGYDAEFARAFADARYGFGGSEGFAGEVGADALLYPADNVILNVGPRAAWGDNSFMDTYFGVSPGESAASGIDAYDPSSGFYSVGVEVGARYQFSPAWGVEGRVNYDYLIDDAADSPITGIGSRNQVTGRVLITRSISLGF